MKKLVLLCAVLAIAGSAQANLLSNGSFEEDNWGMSGYFPGWTQAVFYFPDPPWGTQAPVLNKIASYGIFVGTGVPFDGSFFAGTDFGGHANFHIGLYQTFATTPGQSYLVSGGFMGGVEDSNDTAWWEVLIANGTTTDPDAAGTVIAKKERAAGAGGFSFRETFGPVIFTATESTSTMFLKWGRVQSADYRLEACGFDALSVELVPEPGSLLALASGLAGFAGLALRKRS